MCLPYLLSSLHESDEQAADQKATCYSTKRKETAFEGQGGRLKGMKRLFHFLKLLWPEFLSLKEEVKTVW